MEGCCMIVVEVSIMCDETIHHRTDVQVANCCEQSSPGLSLVAGNRKPINCLCPSYSNRQGGDMSSHCVFSVMFTAQFACVAGSPLVDSKSG